MSLDSLLAKRVRGCRHGVWMAVNICRWIGSMLFQAKRAECFSWKQSARWTEDAWPDRGNRIRLFLCRRLPPPVSIDYQTIMKRLKQS
ncbi:hypothetical protein V8F44DRAFT_600079, partial [Aspergillus fumigatus]